MCTLHRIKIRCYKTKPSVRLWSSESISGINECTSVASDACCNEKLIMYTQHRIRQSIPRKIRCYKIKPRLQPSSSKKSYSVEEWRGVASDWFCNDGFNPLQATHRINHHSSLKISGRRFFVLISDCSCRHSSIFL